MWDRKYALDASNPEWRLVEINGGIIIKANIFSMRLVSIWYQPGVICRIVLGNEYYLILAQRISDLRI